MGPYFTINYIILKLFFWFNIKCACMQYERLDWWQPNVSVWCRRDFIINYFCYKHHPRLPPLSINTPQTQNLLLYYMWRHKIQLVSENWTIKWIKNITLETHYILIKPNVSVWCPREFIINYFCYKHHPRLSPLSMNTPQTHNLLLYCMWRHKIQLVFWKLND